MVRGEVQLEQRVPTTSARVTIFKFEGRDVGVDPVNSAGRSDLAFRCALPSGRVVLDKLSKL